jgi:selenocysteine lyase/cysteine desulfurase
MRRLEISGTVRASFYLYNTPAEVQDFVQSVERAMKFLRTACLVN